MNEYVVNDNFMQEESVTYEVNICKRSGRSSGGGNGKNGVRLSSIVLNSAGIPGNMHSFPSRRTTGCKNMSINISSLWQIERIIAKANLVLV